MLKKYSAPSILSPATLLSWMWFQEFVQRSGIKDWSHWVTVCGVEVRRGIMGVHMVVRSRARDCSYSSREFVRYLSLQQSNPEPSILLCTVPFWSSVPLGLFPSILDPSITQCDLWIIVVAMPEEVGCGGRLVVVTEIAPELLIDTFKMTLTSITMTMASISLSVMFKMEQVPLPVLNRKRLYRSKLELTCDRIMRSTDWTLEVMRQFIN